MSRITIAHAGENEIVIKKSRFITHLARVETPEAAEAFVAEIRRANRKANHNVWAARIGWPVSVERASDDGEPSGTSGAPTLRGLTVHDLSNVVAVTTRYFGGIKLGASGLIRAYTEAVTAAIEHVGMVELVAQRKLRITVDYATYQKVENYLRTADIPAEAEFGAAVTISVYLSAAAIASTQTDLTELTNGQAVYTLGAERVAEVAVNAKAATDQA